MRSDFEIQQAVIRELWWDTRVDETDDAELFGVRRRDSVPVPNDRASVV